MNGISVLIPVYQHNPSVLIKELYKQLSETPVLFEIRVLDDSSQTNYYEEWSAPLHILPNVSVNRLIENKGRAEIRNILVEQALYNWVLFLDADTHPCMDSYIQQFIPFLSESIDAVCGGTAYRNSMNDSAHSLRWKYGKAREEKSAEQRNKCAFKHFTINNLLIRKNCLVKFPLDISIKEYGHEDTLLGMVLERNGVRIKHIDNFVYHDGLDPNEVFVTKIIQSVYTLVDLYKNDKLTDDTKLIQLYKTIHSIRLDGIFLVLVKPVIPSIYKNLTSKKPFLLLLDILKIWHFIKQMRS